MSVLGLATMNDGAYANGVRATATNPRMSYFEFKAHPVRDSLKLPVFLRSRP